MSQAANEEVRALSQGSISTLSNAYTSTFSESDVSTRELLIGASPSSPERQRTSEHMRQVTRNTSIAAQNDHPEYSQSTLQPHNSSFSNSVLPSHAENVHSVTVSSQSGTTSASGSLPYYNISNYSRSINTLDLLQSHEASQLLDPVSNRTQNIRNSESSHEDSVAQISEQFNQVPRRFSQFIVDQSHALDVPEMSSNTSSSMHSRDISLSMGSQATIFSIPVAERRNLLTTPRSELENVCESSSSLERRRAIRCKKGSKLYRLRLHLRKIALRIKRKMGAMRSFFVRPKKATSKVRTTSDRPFFRRSKALKRNQSVQKRIPQISAPLDNPSLNNEAGASRVQGLTDELKVLAGAASKDTRVKISEKDITSRSIVIPRQKATSEAAFSVASSAPAPPPHTDISFRKSILKKENVLTFQGAWKQYLSAVLASRIKLRQEVQLFQLLLANQPVPSVFNPTIAISKAPRAESSFKAESSRGWSASVGEIKSHRASIIPDKYSSTESEPGSFLVPAASSIAPTALSESPSRFTESNHFQDSKVGAQSTSSGSLSIESVSDDESADERIEKLQQVFNRRSMLGEMLDYDSDDIESVASSMFSKESLGARINSPEISSDNRVTVMPKDSPLITRYGTLNRRPTYKSSYYGSSNESAHPSEGTREDNKQMSRSPGIQNLQQI